METVWRRARCILSVTTSEMTGQCERITAMLVRQYGSGSHAYRLYFTDIPLSS